MKKTKWYLLGVGALFMVASGIVANHVCMVSWVGYSIVISMAIGFYFIGAFATMLGYEKYGKKK